MAGRQRNWPVVVGLVVLALFGGREFLDAPAPAPHADPASSAAPGVVERPGAARSAVDAAFEQRRSDVQVAGSGEVVRVLPDDEQGSRHQRFVLRLASGRTIPGPVALSLFNAAEPIFVARQGGASVV